MSTSDLSDLFNDLHDLSLASQGRLASAAALADLPQLKGELSLKAAEHRADCDRLLEWVREFRGTPHDGRSEAELKDPLWTRPIGSRRNDRELLASCSAEEDAVIERLGEALQRNDLPARARQLLSACKESAKARRHSFMTLLSNMG